MASKELIQETILKLERIYTHRGEVAPAAIDTYHLALEGFSDELVSAAVDFHIKTHDWFPNPSNIIRIIYDASQLAAGVKTAELAWGEVVDRLENPRCPTGRELNTPKHPEHTTAWWNDYHKLANHDHECLICKGKQIPEFSHPNIKEAVRVLGWTHLRMSNNVSADRAHFYKTYNSICDRNKLEAIMMPQLKQLADEKRAQIPEVTSGPTEH
jgi:hypothetical protein